MKSKEMKRNKEKHDQVPSINKSIESKRNQMEILIELINLNPYSILMNINIILNLLCILVIDIRHRRQRRWRRRRRPKPNPSVITLRMIIRRIMIMIDYRPSTVTGLTKIKMVIRIGRRRVVGLGRRG